METQRQPNDLNDYVPWIGLCFFAWIGATISGGILGIVASLVEDPNAHEATDATLGMLIGGFFSAILSGVAFSSVGTLSWILGWPRNPRLLIMLAIACVVVLIDISEISFEMWCIVLTIGLGAVVGGDVYLFGPSRQALFERKNYRVRLSLPGLMLRTVAAAGLIVLWYEVLNFELFLMW